VTAKFAAREALIPLVGDAAGGSVARIAADAELAAPHAAHLDRSLIELLENGLYQAGQQAKSAVRQFPLPGHTWLPRASEALHVVNPGDVVGLGAENANSAELGLALALLMFRAQSEQRAVIASGALDLNSGRRDVPVLPVHHLAGKLRLIVRHFSQPGSAPRRETFSYPAMIRTASPSLSVMVRKLKRSANWGSVCMAYRPWAKRRISRARAGAP
jgi:hypothetical protein